MHPNDVLQRFGVRRAELNELTDEAILALGRLPAGPDDAEVGFEGDGKVTELIQVLREVGLNVILIELQAGQDMEKRTSR